MVDNGKASTSTGPQEVTVANLAPTASFTASCTGRVCSLDANASTDPDGTISTYSRSFGDGTSGPGRTATHTYASAGTHALTLTATDNAGATASSSSRFRSLPTSIGRRRLL